MLKATFSAKSNRLCSVQFTFDPTVPARQLARAAMLQGRATPGMAGMMAGMLGMGGVDVSSLVGAKGAPTNSARRYRTTAPLSPKEVNQKYIRAPGPHLATVVRHMLDGLAYALPCLARHVFVCFRFVERAGVWSAQCSAVGCTIFSRCRMCVQMLTRLISACLPACLPACHTRVCKLF